MAPLVDSDRERAFQSKKKKPHYVRSVKPSVSADVRCCSRIRVQESVSSCTKTQFHQDALNSFILLFFFLSSFKQLPMIPLAVNHATAK